ncbi:Terpenoid synthase [Penicillium cf. griseofulvum]|uniref:Terpenoid synthase n=1 Tax=Penicillium cf. griseofulvum TaxID=2972120 RepID=A0A9W9M0H9_9EURO|nr:Terpenoid synthase [Penicillium cf. griseofulvum]KAJ5430593.1 Terpenoid synthase [Penicillium cf. griseofulvum]KAJ5435638.1 Terpenoid synthase [Penicillium cf. griseofulvum]
MQVAPTFSAGPVSTIPSVFESVQGYKVPIFFSRYPAGISIAAREVEDALRRIDELACEEGTRERRQAIVRHANPYGSYFTICHCSAFPERLLLFSCLAEVLWVHDDMTEEMDHISACREHDEMAKVLRLDIDQSMFKSGNMRQKTLAAVLRKAIDIDPAQAPTMIKMLKKYLATFDSIGGVFTRMEDYMPYRIANSGYWMSSYFVRWGMGMALSEEDYASVEQFDIAMGNVLGLTNDYFSWNMEKDQQEDRMRNGVAVLMKEHHTTAEAAKVMLLGVIVEQESLAAKLKEERLTKPASKEILQYFEAIELYVGGSCYWHSTAPRYQVKV